MSKSMSPSTCSTSGDVSILVGGCRIRGAAKYSPITVTDVQSDGRPRAVPRDSHGALPLRDAVAAARLYCGLSGAAAVDRQQPLLSRRSVIGLSRICSTLPGASYLPAKGGNLRWAARPSARPSGLALEGCGLAAPLDARRV
eukprot:scaffold6380_cov121-Isochrysis_galbana.AAC.1